MAGKQKPRILWPQYPPEHIFKPSSEPFPVINTPEDVREDLINLKNDILWILNEDFDQKGKVANKARAIQEQLRRWADRWIEKPGDELFQKELSKALSLKRIEFEIAQDTNHKEIKSKKTQALRLSAKLTFTLQDSTSPWLYIFARMLSKIGTLGLGKCDVCHNYFLDIKHQGKKRCSYQCARLAATRRYLRKKEQTPKKS